MNRKNLDDSSKKRIKELFLEAFSEKYPIDLRETAFICLKSSFGREDSIRSLLTKEAAEHDNFDKILNHFGELAVDADK